MIKLKKALTLTLLLSMTAAPMVVQADEFDEKIQEQNQKIDEIKKTQSSAETQLAEIKANVAKIEKEVADVMAQKTKEEKKLNELHQQIEELKIVIAKRDEQLQKQARGVQTNQSAGTFIDVIVESNSLNEAMEKAVAVTTMVKANNEILEAQQRDKAKVEELAAQTEKSLKAIEAHAKQLQTKQTELADAKLTQEVKIQELNASLATEEGKKKEFEKKKAEAERKRQEQLKALAEQQKREAEARQKMEAQAAAAAAATANDNSTTSGSVGGGGTTAPPAASSGWGAPLSSLVVTSPFGWRANPTGAGSEHHDGVDFAGSTGTPVFATKAGTVVAAEFHYSAGNHVIIKHADGYYSYYMHLTNFAVSNGQTVSQGQTVGGMGTTGNSTGTHLHFGVSRSLWSGFVNPAPLLGV